MSDHDMTHEIAMLDMSDVFLVYESGAGWAMPMDDEGRVPDMDQIFVITARYCRPENVGDKDRKLESVYLAFDQDALELVVAVKGIQLEQQALP